jgi:ankyrin repeat protein
VVRALLGAGADPHIVTRKGETPLAMAVRLGREECVAELQVRSVVAVA